MAFFLMGINAAKAYIQYFPHITYDFENKYINTSLMDGAYSDEGEYIWVSRNCKIKMFNIKKNSIVFVAGNSKDESIIEEIYVNGKYVDNIEIRTGKNEYVILLPEEYRNQIIWEVELKSNYSFVPAKVYENSSDTRELTMQLFYISND